MWTFLRVLAVHVEESLKEAQDGEGADQEVEVQGVQGL